ncbi:hypothetical protein [Oceanospirillum sanctuarii]|uniref:hypothetical protein n=1 Tax=Oceanospirillum sanctuarii TaxID=1434821 RepID=UPI0011234513|nr:hypothetical protein [Oceanospirillum sanctuarii]
MNLLLRPFLLFVFLFPLLPDLSQAGQPTVLTRFSDNDTISKPDDRLPIVLVSAHQKHDYFGVLAELIYQDAFQRLGRKLEIRYAPLRRAEVLHRNAMVDGDVGRTDAFHQQFPEMIRVSEATVSVRYNAYSQLPNIKVNSWDSLRWSSLRIEYQRGDLMASYRLKDIGPSAQLTQVDNLTLGLRKLFAGRTDLFIGMERGINHVMAKSEFRGKKLYRAGFMEAFEGHVYLQPKHRELAAELSDVLKAMAQEGVIERYQQEALHILD